MGAQGTATIDFGSTPVDEASIAVTGQAGFVAATSKAEAFFIRDTTGDNNAEEHEGMSIYCRTICGDFIDDTGFTIRANMLAGFATGQFNIHWVWN